MRVAVGEGWVLAKGGVAMGTPTFDGPEPTDPDLLPSKDDPHTGRLEERRTLREHEDDLAGNSTSKRGEHDETGDQ
jgi:hypothetical protein